MPGPRATSREGATGARAVGSHAGAALSDEIDRARLDLISTLCDDFGVSDDALSIFLSYLDQVHGLRRDMARLIYAIDRQPEAVRKEILEAWRIES